MQIHNVSVRDLCLTRQDATVAALALMGELMSLYCFRQLMAAIERSRRIRTQYPLSYEWVDQRASRLAAC